MWGITAEDLLLISAIVVAIGILFGAVRRIMKFIAVIERLVPLLGDVVNQLSSTPDAFKILKEIIAEFRTNSGSSLRDAINQLTRIADDNKKATAQLEVKIETVRLVAVEEHEEAVKDRARMMKLLQIMEGKVTRIQDELDKEKK